MLTVGGLTTVLVCALLGADTGAQIDRAFQQAAALAAPSVVRIDTVGGRDQLEPGLVASGATTGVVVSEDGYLVTSAFHFASKPSSVIVTLPDGRRLAAQPVATDRQRMITLLKVEADRLPLPQVAPKDSFRVGQWSLALGRTYDAEVPSVSVGIVSALNRIWGKAIQTDAKISPVNYGGPLIDIQGRVMGILVPLSPHATGDTAGVEWYDSGIGFAVPLADIVSVLDRMKTGDDLLPGQLGVVFKGRDMVSGAPLIESVRRGSPAEQAGIKAGDRIVSVEGQSITRVAELKQVLGQKYAGDPLKLEVRRDDQTLPLSLELVGELPPYVAPFVGLQLDRNPEKGGAIVRTVWPESPAAKAGFEPGDQIQKLNDADVTSPDELRTLLTQRTPGENAVFQVARGDAVETLTVTLAAAPSALPEELAAQAAFGVAEKPADLKVGRFTETLAGHDRDFWMYVPEGYRPDQPQSLVVFLHPSLNPMEQAVLSAWRAECERRGIILLAPRVEGPAGWSPNDREFLKDCVAQVRERYTIAPERMAVIGLGNAAGIAAAWSFGEGESVRGLVLIDAPPLGRVPESSPERSLQMYVLSRGRSVESARWPRAIEDLRKAGFPAILATSSEEPGGYPTSDTNAAITRWVDSLDRI